MLPMIFDGHNDVLSKLWREGGLQAARTFTTGRAGALDLPKAKAGGFGGGFFAIYIPSPMDRDARTRQMSQPSYNLPLPNQILVQEALPVALAQAAILARLEELGGLKICKTAKDIGTCLDDGTIAAIMHIEGAEAIDEDMHALDVLYRAGLRSIGPVWSRPTIFANGVPFRFPSDGDIGDGLTEHGIRLVQRCNELGIMLDMSHLNEAGFWDVVKYSDAPIVATHSNAHNLCASSRNLTDKQLIAIAESGGMVGVNFSVSFLRADGQKNAGTDLDLVLAHLDHLISVVGEDCVGLGSDYDGALVPEAITNVSDLPKLRTTMRSHGYDEPLMAKLCHGNWLRVLEKTWGA